MHAKTIAGLAILAALGFSAAGAAPLPRPSPDLVITEPSGKTTSLASFKGKVVVVEFLLTRCGHCAHLAQTIGDLDRDLAPRGFQAVGVAFDVGINGLAVSNLVQSLKLKYPVGYTTSDKVDGFLGRAPMERFQVPQLVVIDRSGVIRAQSRPTGEATLEDENYLRRIVDRLLDEGAPTGKTENSSPASPPG
jgi:thiol-disulfide isomerase/thioredoxin